MTGAALVIALSGALFAAFAAGWCGHWAWGRLANAASPDSERIEELTAELLCVEAERDAIRADKETTEASLAAAHALREDDLSRRLRECEAELETVMDGLGAARRELETLREAG